MGKRMLAQTISDIVQCRQTIEDYKFDETATKQYIILPILRSLNWQDDNLYTLEVFQKRELAMGKLTMLYSKIGPLWYSLSANVGAQVLRNFRHKSASTLFKRE